MNLNSKFIALSVLVCIYVMQTLIDELKQLNIKNRKYIKQAIVLGVCVGLSTIVGVSYLVWIGLAVLSLFITSNLDIKELNNHLSTSKNGVEEIKAGRIISRIEQLTVDMEMISKNLRK